MNETKPASELRICKKCLIRDFDEGELFASIKDYVERLPEALKAEASVYDERLRICLECEKLLSGTCQVCGCYVEMRAAGRNNHCPDVNNKW